jgi:hypothetical protein
MGGILHGPRKRRNLRALSSSLMHRLTQTHLAQAFRRMHDRTLVPPPHA